MKTDKHQDLLLAQESIYEPCNLKLHDYVTENESQEYGACRFQLNDYRIVFRVAKITPTKVGQFVTIWKRIGSGPIMPFDLNDPVDFFIVSVRDQDRLGQFIFPKQVLYDKGYVSKNGNGGKRAMRVYPPWVTVDSPIAHKTKEWQINYFVLINSSAQSQKMVQAIINQLPS